MVMAVQGSGTHFFEDGSRYSGEWVENQRSGWGTLFYANGDKYEGEWSHDMRHGFGTLYLGTFTLIVACGWLACWR